MDGELHIKSSLRGIEQTRELRTKYLVEHSEAGNARIMERKGEPELALLSMPSLSRSIWGLRKGRLTIVAARPSQGKSAFALQIATDLSLQGKTVAFLSLEMDAEELYERVVCNHYKLNNMDLLHGKTDEYVKAHGKFLDEFKNVPFIISDAVGWEWQEVAQFVEDIAVKPDVIIVDYIQAIKKHNMMERGVFDEYIRRVREIAVKNNIAFILLSQINRASQDLKDKAPRLHQLKGSGFLEEHADVVMLLHWGYKYNKQARINSFQLFIEKNRNGPTGIVNLEFYPEWYRFEDEQVEKFSLVIKELNEGQSFPLSA